MSRGRFGAGRRAGWHLGQKVETRSAALGQPRGEGEGDTGLPPGSEVLKQEMRGVSKEDVQGETREHRSPATALGARGVSAQGAGTGPAPLTPRFLEPRRGGWACRPLVLPRRRWGWGGAGLGGVEAGASRRSPCRLWVPRNFRTLPESFQSVKCLGEVGWGGVGGRNEEALLWGRRLSGSCQFLEAGGLASDRNPSYLMIPLVERRLHRLRRWDVGTLKTPPSPLTPTLPASPSWPYQKLLKTGRECVCGGVLQ